MKAVLAAAVAWASVAAPGAARADALLELAAHGPPRPASQLTESACEVDVELRGGLATVELRQHLVNLGDAPVAAGYELAIGEGATLVGATLRDGAGPAGVAIGVLTGFTTTVVHDGGVLGADPLLVQSIDRTAEGRPRFRATLQAIGAAHAVVLATRWAVPASIEGGALHLVVPGRAAEGQLPACRGTIRAAGGPGASVARVRVGRSAGTGGAATFTLGDEDVAIDAELAFHGTEPLVWTQREDLGAGWASELVTVLAPPARALAPAARRAMFVIDGSRSMDMVGTATIGKVVDAAAAALPRGTELDAIVYDRTATRVLGDWEPAERAVSRITAALGKRGAGNGSDLAGALRVAHAALGEGGVQPTSLVVITDGVLGKLPDSALVDALAATSGALDVHVIVLDPGPTRSPGKTLLAAPVETYGGSYVELGLDGVGLAHTGSDAEGRRGSIDGDSAALAGAAAWVGPAWVELKLTGAPAVSHGELSGPLRAGAGGTMLYLTHGAAPAIALRARREAMTSTVAAQVAPVGAASGLGALALAWFAPDDFERVTETAVAPEVYHRALAAHPYADASFALVVLAPGGKVATDRRAMIAGGGPYVRIVSAEDPAWAPPVEHRRAAGPPSSAIERITVERLIRDQLQPAAYACYEHALGPAPKLAGLVVFDINLGRGEVTRVEVAGLGDAAFDACLVDAAYRMTPPVPDLRLNADDQTVVHYPLTFGLADRRPTVVLGDADSGSPLDIDAIQGGVPIPANRTNPIQVDADTPLGSLKPR